MFFLLRWRVSIHVPGHAPKLFSAQVSTDVRRHLREFLMRCRGLSVLHCHGVSVWRGGVFSTSFYGFQKTRFWCDFVVCPSFTAMVSKCGGDAGFSSRSFLWISERRVLFFLCDFVACLSFTAMVFQCNSVGGLFQQKFPRTSEDALGTFLLRFRGLSVLHCHCVFSVAAGVFSTFKIHVRKFFAAISWLVRSSLPWCFFRCGGGCFPNFQKHTLRSFLVRFPWLVRPSLPWCFSVAGWCFQHKFLRISADMLGSFLLRFRALSVLHRHGVSVWQGAVLAQVFYGFQKTIFAARPSFTAIVFSVWRGGWFQQQKFLWISERHVLFFFGAISWLVCPSLPCVSM